MGIFFWKRTKKFVSDQQWFQMNIPVGWERYEDCEGTYAFYDPINWKGNFRITPLQLNKDADDSAIDGIGNQNNATKIRIGDLDSTFYVSEIKSKNEDSVMYNWIFHKMNYVFNCSYTTDYANKDSDKINAELSKATLIIKSLKLL